MEEFIETFPKIGSLYLIGEVFIVIGNDTNNFTTKLKVVTEGKHYGKIIDVPTLKVIKQEPLCGPLRLKGEVVMEDGVEFLKTEEQKEEEPQTLAEKIKTKIYSKLNNNND